MAYLIVIGAALLYVFYNRQKKLEAAKKNPLLKVSMLSIPQLRSGLSVLLAQYLVIGAVFFIMPVYLQMTLGLDALETGLRILPLSIALVLGSIYGAGASSRKTPKRIVRSGQYLLVVGVLILLGSIDIELRNILFALGMFVIGLGLGLLASQLGNINMSAVSERDGSEVGGMQGVFQNLGSSMGTAIIGSILVGALTTSFVSNVQSTSLPSNIKQYVQENSTAGVAIVSVTQVEDYAVSQGVSQSDADELGSTYAQSQIEALRTSLFVLFAVALLMVTLSRNIPNTLPKRS